jgi:mRNA-degrading endonuclease toxin of MazEF toxin-antitoxin module
MPRIQPKDVWMVHLPDTQANEQTGDRPAIILSVHPQTGMAMIVPLTKHLESLRFPYTCKIFKSAANGLNFDSVALVFHMRSMANSTTRFQEKIGTIEEAHLKQIKTLIKDYLAIV